MPLKRNLITLLGLLSITAGPAFSEPRVLHEGRLGEYDDAHRASVAAFRDKIFVAASVHMPGEANPLAKVYLWSSTDTGRTWTAPEKLSDGPFDDVGAGLCITGKGTLLLNYSTSLGWALEGEIQNPARRKWWDEVKQTSLLEVNREVNFWMRRSDDGGKSWSQPYPIPCNPLAGATALADGHLFMFGHRSTDSIRQMIGGERNNFILTSAVSSDDGVTWTRLKDFAGVYGDGLISTCLHETGYAENRDGQVVVVLRNPFSKDQTELRQFEVLEGDHKQWSPIHTVGAAWSFNVISLKGERLLMSYLEKKQAAELHARLSTDGGKTWQEAGKIAGGTGEILPGFSSAQLDDGSLITVWFEKAGDQSLKLHYQIWRL